MKKLLCMALAIMLLVSAVPVFAAAADVAMPYLLVIDGTTKASSTFQTVDTQSLSGVLEEIFPGYAAQYNVGYKIDGVVADGAAAVPVNGTVTFELTTPPTPQVVVTIKLGDQSRDINVDKGGSVTLNQALLNSVGLSLSYNHVIAQWNDLYNPTTPIANGTTVTVNENNTFTCTQRNNSVAGENGGSSNSGGSNNGVTTYNVKFYDVNGSCHWNINVASGSTVGIADNSTATQISYAEEHVGTKSGYTFSGWQKNGTGDVLSTATVADLAITANTEFRPVFTANSSSSGSGSSGTTTNKFPYDVYLNIYKDTLVGSADKSVKITNGIALDGLVTLAEVKNVVKNYYTAKDSDGISYDGLYLAQGNWVANYVADTQKYDSIKAGEMRQTGTVYINVMIGNAKAKSTATADTSNPKTGDTIFVPFMVMGVTATALAAAYVFGKKRIAR